MGDSGRAERYLRSALEAMPDEPLVISCQGLLHAVRQQVEPALDCIRRSCEASRSFGHSHHTYYLIACTYAVLGDKQKGFDWLERSVETGFPCWGQFANDLMLRNLRDLPEFQFLVEALQKKYGSIPLELPKPKLPTETR